MATPHKFVGAATELTAETIQGRVVLILQDVINQIRKDAPQTSSLGCLFAIDVFQGGLHDFTELSRAVSTIELAIQKVARKKRPQVDYINIAITALEEVSKVIPQMSEPKLEESCLSRLIQEQLVVLEQLKNETSSLKTLFKGIVPRLTGSRPVGPQKNPAAQQPRI